MISSAPGSSPLATMAADRVAGGSSERYAASTV
jgi:hypothetical protein